MNSPFVNSIIPKEQYFYANDSISTTPIIGNLIDYESIALWLATGFFLDNNTFFKDVKVLRPSESIKDGKPQGINWSWHYSPKEMTLNQAVDEFQYLFEKIINKSIKNKNIVLPLSGGIDSRSIAASLKNKKNINVISYEFQNGIKETDYAKEIAKQYKWNFNSFKIPKGYLWNTINTLSKINFCQTEFTHPRQMAAINHFPKFGDLMILGHWGDVLFDSNNINSGSSIHEQTKYIVKNIAKTGGIKLASELWAFWDIGGTFKEHLTNKIEELLTEIKIDSPKGRIRAFKSLNWAPRWANVNTNVFKSVYDIITPYYDDQMCKFICTVPESLLKDRKIQIEYIKRKAPNLAKIRWQAYDLNLYNYKYYKSVFFPKRVKNYMKRLLNEKILNKPQVIQRNWELQFLGEENDKNLKKILFETSELFDLVPRKTIEKFYQNFKTKDRLEYSHPISMLLTLAIWCRDFWKKN